VRTGVVLVTAALLAAPVAAYAATPYWSAGKALRRLDGVAIKVGTRKVRVDSETTLCSGYGTSIRREGVRRWRHFACTYTTFTRAFVDRDLDFRLHVRGARRFSVSHVRWIGAARA
jgi:hypothetical protein